LSEGIIAYDKVVVDEAARANPPDLLIALTQGRKIILVGDDRQLPQLIEDNLVDKVLENADTDIRKETEDTLRMSMFEYLKNRIIQLEQKDDIKRFIQLKTQFRMHPFLGDFVSEQFYENSLENGIKDVELFRHDLPGTGNKPALWHDVPFLQDRGPERSWPSWRRRSEAIYIAQKLSEWIDIQGPNGKKFSFGVISFYAAQTPALLEAFNAKGLCEKQDNGLHVKEQYVDRLEVGTVDAFQGKEFDVVFLSLVRSGDINNIKNDRKTFGHLVFTNRLCVGMSRQKKLLVVVGDRELMKTEAARDHVPALYNFCAICQTKPEGGML
jgi:superfamily I DNA and/or RNA helicase